MTTMRRAVPTVLSAAARCGVRRGRLAADSFQLRSPIMLLSGDPSSFADRTGRSISVNAVVPPAASGAPTRAGTCCNHPRTLRLRLPNDRFSFASSIAWRASAIQVDKQRASYGAPQLCRGSTRLFSSSADSSQRVGDGFDPFKTHHNAKDAKRADQMVRDLMKRRLACGDGIEIREGFFRGALNSYRILSERAAERARRGGKRRPDATFAKKADELLAFVEQAYAKDPALAPDSKSYTMLVDAYAKIGDPERAEAVLLRLEKLWRSGNEKVKPNTILYNVVIDAWAKSGRREAPKRAEDILQHMERLNQQGHKDVRPDTISYGAVINALAKSREKGAAQRAEAILNNMLMLYEGGREECQPDTMTFTSVVDAWARSRDTDAPRRAEALLEKMEEMYRQGNTDVRPTTISYSTVINAWAKSREKGGAQRAEAILHHILKLHEGGREECRPDSMCFTSVIDAWAKSQDKNAYHHALKLIQQMHSMGKDARPDVFTYNSLINALAVSSVPDKATKAFEILIETEDKGKKGNRDVAPDTYTYGAVMKACARTSGKQEARRKALRVALETFDKVRKSPELAATPMIYDSLFNTIAIASKGSEYAKLVNQIFQFCCEDGVLNDVILRNLRRNSPRDVFEKMVGTATCSAQQDVSVADLLPEWSRNTKRR